MKKVFPVLALAFFGLMVFLLLRGLGNLASSVKDVTEWPGAVFRSLRDEITGLWHTIFGGEGQGTFMADPQVHSNPDGSFTDKSVTIQNPRGDGLGDVSVGALGVLSGNPLVTY